jgi:hypothetical protein
MVTTEKFNKFLFLSKPTKKREGGPPSSLLHKGIEKIFQSKTDALETLVRVHIGTL